MEKANHTQQPSGVCAPAAIARRKRRRTSNVWKDFTRSADDTHNICNICGSIFFGESTSSLKKHLQNEHADVALALRDTAFLTAQADALWAYAFVQNFMSLRIIDDPKFREAVTYLRPSYSLPSRKQLRDALLPAKRERLEAAMRAKMETIEAFSVSFDSWTSAANLAYVAVMCHGITSDWVLETFLLALEPVVESETGAYLAHIIEDTLDAWKLDETRVMAFVSDSASNARNAVEAQMRKPWIGCFAHMINLSVRKGLEHHCVSDAMRAAKAVCGFFKRSTKAARALKKKQKQLDLPTHRLVVDNATRWGSAYKMLSRMCESRPAISACLAQIAQTRDPVPDDLTSSQ